MSQLVKVSTGGRLNLNKWVNFDPKFRSANPIVSCVDVGTRGTGCFEGCFEVGS